MKSRKRVLFALFSMMLLAMLSFTPQPSYALDTGATAAAGEPSVCPGRGERCARTTFLGIGIWLKKTPGGPGIEVEM